MIFRCFNLNLICGVVSVVRHWREWQRKNHPDQTILGQIPALNGRSRLGTNVKLGYMAQEQETLQPDLNPFQTILQRSSMNETETRYFLSKYLFKGEDVFVPNHKLSFGERARLNMACLVADGCNFLILDEPINHLDIPSRTQLNRLLETSTAQF